MKLILKFISILSLIYYTQTTATLIDEDTVVNSDYLDYVPESESKLSIEAESLQKLNDFLLKSVDSVLTKSLPLLIQTGLEANLSGDCINSLSALFQGLKSSKEWAFRMLDASGKPPSGILEATLSDLGSFDECINLKAIIESNDIINEKYEYLKGQYCILDLKAAFEQNLVISNGPPANIANDSILWNEILQLFWSRNSLLSLRFGICVPSTCTQTEIDNMANLLIEEIGLEADVNNCQVPKNLQLDYLQIFILCCFGVILGLVIIGTLADTLIVVPSEKPFDAISKKSWSDFIIFFSIISNIQKVFEKNKKQNTLQHLNGVRFLSTLWIIMGHTYFFTDFVHYHHYRSLKEIRDIDDSVAFMPFANFTLSVNTFFFISGLLVVHSSWKKLTQAKGKIDAVNYISHKIWRIWPPYLVVIGLVVILPLMGSGPLWPQAVESTAQVCRQNWLYNILFLNNFQPPNELCLIHTWFLSAHIQFHLFSTFILFLLFRYPKKALLFSVFLIISSGVGVYVYTIIYDLHWPTVIADEVFTDFENKILTLYIMPYNHLGSYLVGIIFGYLLLKHQDKLISFPNQVLCWLICILILLVVIFAPYSSFNGIKMSAAKAGLYLATHRTAWSIAVGWIVFVCATNRNTLINKILSCQIFEPLGKLSFLAYLIHPLLIIIHTGRVRERILFAHYELMNIFLARSIMAFGLAFILYIMVELPFASFEKYISRPKLRSRSKSCNLRSNNQPILTIFSKNIPSLTVCRKCNEFL